jgi:proteic killer suppression protein
MIRSYKDKTVKALVEDGTCKPEWRQIKTVALRKLDMLKAAGELKDLRAPPGNRREALKGDREGQYSIRINDQWRICFRWIQDEAEGVEICDYH